MGNKIMGTKQPARKLRKSLSLMLAISTLLSTTAITMLAAPIQASAETPTTSSLADTPAPPTDSSGLDHRPFAVQSNKGGVKISRDNGATWSDYSMPHPAASDDATDAVIQQLVLDFAKEGLQELAGSTHIPMLSFGTGKLFDLVFQKDSSDIGVSLDTINDKLGQISLEINTKLDQLQNTTVKSQLQGQISLYSSDIKTYEAVLDNLKGQQDLIDKLPDGDEKAAEQKIFLENIYNTPINGTDFCTQVCALGKHLTEVNPSTNKDLFGTFDQIALYSYKWEHQGYDTRRTFQASVLGLYVPLATFAQMSLAAAKQYHFPKNSSGVKPEVQYNNLLKGISAANNMAKKEQIHVLPNTERHYQVPGHPLMLSASADARQVPTNLSREMYRMGIDDLHNALQNVQFNSLFKNVPSVNWLKQVYTDYGSSTELWNIFFNPNEGNLSAGAKIKNGDAFLTSEHPLDWDQHDHWFFSSDADYKQYATVMYNNASTASLQLTHGSTPDRAHTDNQYYNDQKGVNFIGLNEKK